ncbi:efflux RND transporter periplasmic adaptor subunit [Stappia sp. F7233]|uniref:Efflux RND transporter periplasmic adaptor subunit n=1 Tax=Stappia albiluteola TaxID=2758565 RepID=A0A839ABY7_9HYPH|nr:efflux RND transporter periplasmic adaptor subunit [Stappia albiluteola]MBA5776548.1 efflux RND transporter periplasmic adaptor subunit [Stappia albiluteola]
MFSIKVLFGAKRAGSFVCLTALALAACDSQENTAAQAPAPSVMVSAARTEDVRRSADFVGQVQAVDDIQLVARVSGFLESKNVEDGAKVDKDTLLFTIEKAPYQAELLSAKADQAKAEADDALKIADLERDKDLYEKGHVSKAKYEATLASKEQADAVVEASKAAVTQAELNLSYTDIKAPFPGQIGKTNFSVGDVVGPSSGSLARLVRLSPIYVSFSLSEQDYLTAVKGGALSPEEIRSTKQRPNVGLVLPNGVKLEETGEIVFIDNAVDPKTGTISLRARFENERSVLVPGTFVTVVLEATEAQQELVIPQAAVQRDQRGAFVLAVNDQEMVEQRYVELGDQYQTDYVVQEGLQPGERVIVQGLQKVRPGVPVNAVVAGKPVE